MKKLFSTVMVGLVVIGLVMGVTSITAHADWPERDITIVVYSGEGGATDISNRAIAEGMKKHLPVDVAVANMPGAMGGTATSYVWELNDSHTFLGTSEGLLGLAVQEYHHTTSEDWEFFLVGGTPGVISVSKDSPYKSMDDLLTAIKENPGELTIATSIPGCIWHIQYLTLQKHGNLDIKFVPYEGSHNSIIATVQGEVDIALTGLGEQSEFLKGEELRPLAMFQDESAEFNGKEIPPITDFVPEVENALPLRQFVGFTVRSDFSDEVINTITEAFKKGMEEEPVQEYAENMYSDLYGLTGEEAEEMVQKQERLFAWLLWEEGIATKSPKEFGIPKPEGF